MLRFEVLLAEVDICLVDQVPTVLQHLMQRVPHAVQVVADAIYRHAPPGRLDGALRRSLRHSLCTDSRRVIIYERGPYSHFSV